MAQDDSEHRRETAALRVGCFRCLEGVVAPKVVKLRREYPGRLK
jgi:hypothetical protein